jgi:hypothetical protein
VGNGLLEDFEPLGAKFGLHQGEASDVPTWPPYAGDVPRPNRIGMQGKNDWNRQGRLPGGLDVNGALREDEIYLEAD